MIHILSQSFSLPHSYYLLLLIISQNHYTPYDYKDIPRHQPKNTAWHICTGVREWLWHSKCHNRGR